MFALDTGGSSATPVRLESPGSLQLAQDDEHPLGDILSGQFSQLLSPLQTEQQQQQQQASPLQSQQQSHPLHDAWLQLHAGDILNEEEDAEERALLDELRRGEYEGLSPAAAEATNDVLLSDAVPSDFDEGPLYDSEPGRVDRAIGIQDGGVKAIATPVDSQATCEGCGGRRNKLCQDWLQCDRHSCRLWYHQLRACLGDQQEEDAALYKIKHGQRWTCPSCREPVLPPPAGSTGEPYDDAFFLSVDLTQFNQCQRREAVAKAQRANVSGVPPFLLVQSAPPPAAARRSSCCYYCGSRHCAPCSRAGGTHTSGGTTGRRTSDFCGVRTGGPTATCRRAAG